MQGKFCVLLTAIFALAIVSRYEAGAQSGTSSSSEVVTELGLHRAIFHIPKGTIRVNLPDDLSAGDSISGTVYLEASGKDQKEKDRNSGELSGYVVEMEGQRVRSSEKHFRLRMPNVATGLSNLVLRDRQNRIVERCKLTVDPRQAPAPEFVLPLGGQAGSLISARGPFASDTVSSVSLGGTSASVIAESPRKIVFQTPVTVVGVSTLEVKSGALTAAGPFRSLGLEVRATRENLIRGQRATMTVEVSGLVDVKEPVSLIIVNRSPSTVALEGGVVQQLAIDPAEVQTAGTFRLTRTLTGVEGGGFNIFAFATMPPTSQVALERLAGISVDSWSRNNNVPVSPEARFLITSGVAAARPQLDDFLRSQLVFRADPPFLIDSLVRNYCFDLRDKRPRIASGPGLSRRSPMANAFAPQTNLATIDAAAVRAFTFLQDFAQVLARLTPSRPVGGLVVISKPDRQLITIDRTTGMDFYTTRTFVVSVGDHLIHVASCQEAVNVSAYQKVTVSCPRQ
jgi:hypothetical protein